MQNSKESILRCSAFFTVQHPHPYMTTGKTTALTRLTFAGKVISLLFNTLSRMEISLPKKWSNNTENRYRDVRKEPFVDQ